MSGVFIFRWLAIREAGRVVPAHRKELPPAPRLRCSRPGWLASVIAQPALEVASVSVFATSSYLAVSEKT